MNFIKKVIYTDYYNALYPLEDHLQAVGLIRSGEWKKENNTDGKPIRDLIKVLKSEIKSTELDIAANNRAENNCIKTKKIKIKYKDEKNNKHKTKEKVKVTKRGFGQLREKYISKIVTLDEYKQSVEDLLDKVENGNITLSDYDLLNSILIKNRFSLFVGLLGFAVFIILISVLIIGSINSGIIQA